jgi:hypothetical protein
MRDLAFAAFRIAAVVHACTYLVPVMSSQLSFLPYILKEGEPERNALLLWGTAGYVAGTLLTTLLLFFAARPLSKLLPDRPLPNVTLDLSFVASATLVIAGIALIADGAGFALLLVQDGLQWANILEGKPNMELWSPEAVGGSQILGGIIFLFIAGRR